MGDGVASLHMVFAVLQTVDQVNHWSLTPVRSNNTVSRPDRPKGLSHRSGDERSHSKVTSVKALPFSTAKQA